MEQAFRYRFFPTTEQELLLRRTMGCVRLIYNRALAARTEAWYERQEKIDYVQTSSLLTQWKKQDDLQFLNEVSCVPLQQGLRYLQKAFSNFFSKRAKYPRFKRKRNGGSAEFTKSAFKWKDGSVWLAKCKDALRIVWSRPIPQGCEPSTITVKYDASGRWFVSLLVDNLEIKPLPAINKTVGIDVGITSLIATSDGEKIGNPKHFNRKYKRLKQAQKVLSRRQKDSRNREKARVKVARIHAAISDARKDFIHKLTTQLIRENQTIAVEDLSVCNMVKNHKLARSISDAAWGEFVRQLEYKSKWYGRTLVKIDRWFPSSKRCGNCGHIVEKLPLNIREWTCQKCGSVHDRDLNAARNINAAGLAVIGNTENVCGSNVSLDEHCVKEQLRKTRKGKKQKPES